MNLVDERMERAGAELRERVSAMPHPAFRRARPARRSRAALAGLAVGVALAAAVALPLLWLRAGEPPAQPVAEPASPAGFPRVMVNVDALPGDLTLNWVVDEALQSYTAGGRHLVVLGPPDGDPASPRIWLETVAAGSDLFLGEAYRDAGWTALVVPAGQAFSRDSGGGVQIVWDTGAGPGGPAVFAYGHGVPAAGLVEVVRSLAPAGHGWAPAAMPDGFSELYAGPAVAGGTRRVVLGWDDRDRPAEVALELQDGGPGAFEHALFQRLGRDAYLVAATAAADVRGRPAVRIDGDGGGTTFAWMETADVFARLHVTGLAAERAAAALVDADPAAWDAVLAQAADEPATPDTSVATSVFASPGALLDDLGRDLVLPPGGDLDTLRSTLAEATSVEEVVGAAATEVACQWAVRWQAASGGQRTDAARALLGVVEVAAHYAALPEHVVVAAGAAAQGDGTAVASFVAGHCG